MKTFIIIVSLVLIAIAVIYLSKGCGAPATKTDLQIKYDSLKAKYDSNTLEQEARRKLDSGLIHDQTSAFRDTTAALQQARKLLSVRDKQIFATNKTLHAALIIHDTPAVYKNAEYLSFQLDSSAQEKWNVDRELDRQQVLMEQLRITDSISLAHCHDDLNNTRTAASVLVATKEEQHQQDAKALKKAKVGKGLWGGLGALIGGAIRSFIK